MDWKSISQLSDLEKIRESSFLKPQVIFKHSTRCSISHVAKSRLERGPVSDSVDYHYLDLINFREISNKIAEDFQVSHESPQILLIIKGECTLDSSHNDIRPEEIIEQASMSA